MVVSNNDIIDLATHLHQDGITVVTTNGCFDILHIGHKRLLISCANYGKLLVLVNSDRSVRALKGAGRPHIPEAERAELIDAFGCVDYVTIFDDDDPIKLLKAIDPDVHCKGADYELADIPERKYVRRVERIPITPEKSSTSLINNIVGKQRLADVEKRIEFPRIFAVNVDAIDAVKRAHNHKWGDETWVENDEVHGVCCKFLTIFPGFKSSMHAHGNRDEDDGKWEHFIILSGELVLYVWEQDMETYPKRPRSPMKIIKLQTGDKYYIPEYTYHKFETGTREFVLLLEISGYENDKTHKLEASRQIY